MKCPLVFLIVLGLTFAAHAQDAQRVDVCVYGATSAGVIAAVTAKQLGRSVLLVEPGRHLGGMSSGGLGWTDFGNKAAIGGLSLEFYKRIGEAKGKTEAVWVFEPSVAERTFERFVQENDVTVLFEHSVVDVTKDRSGRITRARFAPSSLLASSPQPNVDADVRVVEAAVFIDCSYEGDLMARAGVKYAVGREPVATYDEPHNGIRAETPKHQFPFAVDPFNKAGDPKSGLIPLIQPSDPPQKPGDGDRRVQAYNFRLCLTNDPANRIPITAPPGYDPRRYELLARHVDAMIKGGKGKRLGEFMHIQMVTPTKTDINNNGAVSTDVIGANYGYPEADYATRAKIWEAHKWYTQGFLYYLATSDRIPRHLRDEMNTWGYCKDEFPDADGWPHQLYVREARRMIGQYVITERDCTHTREFGPAPDSIGLGAYNMDSHNCQRIVQGGVVRNEGDVQVRPAGPYRIPYRAVTPKADQCTNLLVPVCLSASHIAYGSARMEPVFMVLGESVAVAANIAIKGKTTVQEIDTGKLQATLKSRGQVLEWAGPVKSGS
jgi:hypothetical protein